jgi:anti-sigma factor RsiW
MNCPLETRNSELPIAYAAGELDAAAAAAFERHLEICPGCQELAVAQRAVWEAMDAWEAPPVSADFDQRLYRRIHQEEAQPSWWERFVRMAVPMPFRQAVPLAATACLLLVAGLMVQDRHTAPAVSSAPATVQVDQVENTLDDLELLRQFNAPIPANSVEAQRSDAM